VGRLFLVLEKEGAGFLILRNNVCNRGGENVIVLGNKESSIISQRERGGGRGGAAA